MAIQRTAIVRGPGAVKFGSVVIHDANGITAEIESATQEVPSSISGPLDTIKTDQTATVGFTPCGQITADILAALYPHQTPAIGSSLCGSSDKALVVHSLAGQKVEFFNAFLSQVPDLLLSPVKTAFGAAQFTALLGLGKAPGDTDAFCKVTAATYNLNYPDPEGLTGVHYAGTFGSLSIPDTADGWTVSVELATEPVATDGLGTIDHTLSGVTVRAKCTPIGLSESQILAALPFAMGRGASLRGENDLVIAGSGGLTVTLKNASLVTGPLAWGNTTLRVGEVGFVAHRSFTSGVAGPLYSVAITSSGNNG